MVSYSLAYIDLAICAKDNGRVLGFDNNPGYHHLHAAFPNQKDRSFCSNLS